MHTTCVCFGMQMHYGSVLCSLFKDIKGQSLSVSFLIHKARAVRSYWGLWDPLSLLQVPILFIFYIEVKIPNVAYQWNC